MQKIKYLAIGVFVGVLIGLWITPEDDSKPYSFRAVEMGSYLFLLQQKVDRPAVFFADHSTEVYFRQRSDSNSDWRFVGKASLDPFDVNLVEILNPKEKQVIIKFPFENAKITTNDLKNWMVSYGQ